MKRSEINAAIRWAMDMLQSRGVRLPALAYWSPEELHARRHDIGAVRRLALGWDVTDFGSGDFANIGAVLYTVRNGLIDDSSIGVPYCEKYIVMRDGQRMPSHYHAFKTEDIINRFGGSLAIRLWNVVPGTIRLLDTDVIVDMDGFRRSIPAGEEIYVQSGESVTLAPNVAHQISSKKGSGYLILGEVSRVNNDNTDNFFLDGAPRFTKVEDDEPPIHLLCNEYPPV